MNKGSVSQEETDQFYDRLATFANTNGVTIDLISIEGAEWDLQTLITLSEKTGGDVDIIEPSQAGTKLDGLIQKNLIAMKVKVKVQLHRAFEFRNEESKVWGEIINLLKRSLGNVYEDTEISFEYKVKELSELNNLDDFEISNLDQVPFQAVVEYTKPNGVKLWRVVTHVLKVNSNLEEVLNEVKIEILASNASQQTAKIAKKGNLIKAQTYSLNQKRLISQIVHSEEQKELYKEWRKTMTPLYKQINDQIEKEKIILKKQLESKKDCYSYQNRESISLTKAPDRLQLL